MDIVPKAGFCFGHIVSQLVGKRLQVFVVVIVGIHVLDPFFFPPPAPASGGELNRKDTLLKDVCQGGLKKTIAPQKKT